jgi:hypothetical protein
LKTYTGSHYVYTSLTAEEKDSDTSPHSTKQQGGSGYSAMVSTSANLVRSVVKGCIGLSTSRKQSQYNKDVCILDVSGITATATQMPIEVIDTMRQLVWENPEVRAHTVGVRILSVNVMSI